MPDPNDLTSAAQRARARIQEFLANMAQQNISQLEVARRTGVPHQFVSDIKHGRRPLSELTARRLAEEFSVNYQWLLGRDETVQRPQFAVGATSGSGAILLPVLDEPAVGEPGQSPRWDGSRVEIVGAAVARLREAERPYVLRFGGRDVLGRLHKGDLILVSQALNENAEINVVEHRRRLHLARRDRRGSWSRLASSAKLPSNCPVRGHCVGVVWSALC